MQSTNDNQLRELAHKRVDFRRHLAAFLVINTILWSIWLITKTTYPWPIWPTAGWGIGILFHYLFDYRKNGFFSEDEEFERLKRSSASSEKTIKEHSW